MISVKDNTSGKMSERYDYYSEMKKGYTSSFTRFACFSLWSHIACFFPAIQGNFALLCYMQTIKKACVLPRVTIYHELEKLI